MGKITQWQSWQEKLQEYGAELQGHRLVWRKNVDPEIVKSLKAKRRDLRKLL